MKTGNNILLFLLLHYFLHQNSKNRKDKKWKRKPNMLLKLMTCEAAVPRREGLRPL